MAMTMDNLIATIMQGQALAKGQKDAKETLTKQYDSAARASVTIRRDPVTGEAMVDEKNKPAWMLTGEDPDKVVEKAYVDPMDKVRAVLKSSGMPVYSEQLAGEAESDTFGERKKLAQELGARGPFAFIDAARLANDDLRKRNLDRVNQQRIERDLANYNKLRPVIEDQQSDAGKVAAAEAAARKAETDRLKFGYDFIKDSEDLSSFETEEDLTAFFTEGLSEFGLEPTPAQLKAAKSKWTEDKRKAEKEIEQLEKMRKAATAPKGGKPRAPKAPLQSWSVGTKLRAIGMPGIDQDALALSLDSDYSEMRTNVEDAQVAADQATAEVNDLVGELQELQAIPVNLRTPEETAKIKKLEEKIAAADLKSRQHQIKIRRWTQEMGAIEAAFGGGAQTPEKPAQDRLGLFN